jgi:hypothetical protein
LPATIPLFTDLTESYFLHIGIRLTSFRDANIMTILYNYVNTLEIMAQTILDWCGVAG